MSFTNITEAQTLKVDELLNSLFLSDDSNFYFNFERWNSRLPQNVKLNTFKITGRTQYKNMNSKQKKDDVNFINTYHEFLRFVAMTDIEDDKDNFNYIIGYIYRAKSQLEKAISDFEATSKGSEDYKKYEEDLYNILEDLLIVKNVAGTNLRGTFMAQLRKMIKYKYITYGDKLNEVIAKAEIKNVINVEILVNDTIMINLYLFGYLQRLLIPLVSHWLSVFKEKRDKNDSDDPLNIVLARIWNYVMTIGFSKTNREILINKIQKKIKAVVVTKKSKIPKFFELWSRQGFDYNNMLEVCYHDFMFRSLFKIELSSNERSKGLGFIDGVISNRANLIFGDRIKEGDEIHVIKENKGTSTARRSLSETHYSEDAEEYNMGDRGLDDFNQDDRVESLFRVDDGIFVSLREMTIEQLFDARHAYSIYQRLDIKPEEVKKYPISQKRTRLHNYVLNAVVGSVVDMGLIQSGIKAKDYYRIMSIIYTYLEKNDYNNLLGVLLKVDLADIKRVLTDTKKNILLEIKDAQLHNILKQNYSKRLSLTLGAVDDKEKDKIFDYIMKICGSVGENQLEIEMANVEGKEMQKISLTLLGEEIMKLIINFSR